MSPHITPYPSLFEAGTHICKCVIYRHHYHHFDDDYLPLNSFILSHVKSIRIPVVDGFLYQVRGVFIIGLFLRDRNVIIWKFVVIS